MTLGGTFTQTARGAHPSPEKTSFEPANKRIAAQGSARDVIKEGSVDMKLLVDGRIAEADEIKLMGATPEGLERVRMLVKSTVVAFSVDNIMAFMREINLLTRQPTDEEANDICNVLWACLYQRKQGALDEYVDAVADRIVSCGMDTPETIQ